MNHYVFFAKYFQFCISRHKTGLHFLCPLRLDCGKTERKRVHEIILANES